MKDIQREIGKEELLQCPLEELPISAVVIGKGNTVSEVEQACRELSEADFLGFDTETRPQFVKNGSANKVALVQLSSHHKAYLFRIQELSKQQRGPLVTLLESPHTVKVGVGIKADVLELFDDHGIATSGIIDLDELKEIAGMKVASLSKLYAVIYGKRLSKSQSCSNWEASPYTHKQIHYAALDAYAGLRIFDALTPYYRPEQVLSFQSVRAWKEECLKRQQERRAQNYERYLQRLEQKYPDYVRPNKAKKEQ